MAKTVTEDAPRLDRGKGRFSEAFGARRQCDRADRPAVFVDLCLRKQADQRPTCDKLRAHNFVKRAPKKSHLYSTILADLPPLCVSPFAAPLICRSQARQTRVRLDSLRSARQDASWNFSTSSPTTTFSDFDQPKDADQLGALPTSPIPQRRGTEGNVSPPATTPVELAVPSSRSRRQQSVSFDTPEPPEPVDPLPTPVPTAAAPATAKSEKRVSRLLGKMRL